MPSKTAALFVSLPLFLSGCAAPPALQVLSLALDGISYLATDKTLADHGLSAVTQKDCKLLRGLKDKKVCQEEQEKQEASIREDASKATLLSATPPEQAVR